MASAISSVTSQSLPIPIKSCGQCGTDKRLSVCGRCHIEKYCSQSCQGAAWPKHKLVCVSTKKEISSPHKSVDDVDVKFRFHDSEILTEHLSANKALNQDYFQEKGITQAIVGLAAKRFANKNVDALNIKLGVVTIFLDLTKGKDGFTGGKLPKIALTQMTKDLLAKTLEMALIDSTKIKLDDGKIKG